MSTITKRKSSRWVLGLFALGLGLSVSFSACKEVIHDNEALLTFKVRVQIPEGVEEDLVLGTEDEPLPFVSGFLCDITADAPCPVGQRCIPYCEEDGRSCEDDGDCPGNYERCVGSCARSVDVTIEAISTYDRTVPFEGFLEIKSIPGSIPPPKRFLYMRAGVVEKQPLWFSRGVGETLLWVEESGYLPLWISLGECLDGEDNDSDGLVDFDDPDCEGTDDAAEGPGKVPSAPVGQWGQCNDGVDNDGNGVTDLADAGCEDATDGIEHAVSGVAGVSDKAMIFENPRIRNLQYTSAVATSSPLQGQEIRIDEGQFVVTNVTSNGLFITDLDDQRETLDDGQPGYYNSIFLFTWSTPDNVGYGDRLCWISGGVVEHEGNTQMTFPSFWAFFGDLKDPECMNNPSLNPSAEVPDPVAVTHLLVEEDPEDPDFASVLNRNSISLEPFENGLVKVEKLELSTRFIACDANENGDIEWGGDEEACRDVCQNDFMCTQLEGFFKYKQYAVYVDKKKKMNLSGEMLKEFSPLNIEFIGQEDLSGRCTQQAIWIGDTRFVEYRCPERHLDSASGNLRHLFLCPETWDEDRCELQFHTLVPRFDDDIVEGDGSPASPETETPTPPGEGE